MMKWIFAMICLLVCFAMIAADEADYQAFLERNPDYVKVQNEYKILQQDGHPLQTRNSPEDYRASLEFVIKHFEKKMLENRILCAAAEDPANFALAKEYFKDRKTSRFELNELPKKDVPGSPGFQHAMYVVDRLKEDYNFHFDAYRTADTILKQNLEEIAFDDPEWRKIYYEYEYASLAAAKRNSELNLENLDLYIPYEIALRKLSSENKEKHLFISEEKSKQISGELWAKREADPTLQKLKEEHFRLFQEQLWALGRFARKSDSTEAKEYREFKAAVNEAEKEARLRNAQQ